MPQVPGKAVAPDDVPVDTFQPGESVTDPIPGDFFLTHGDGFESRLIRWGEHLRFRGANAMYAWYNHAGIFVGRDGSVVESQPVGVVRRNISHYTPRQYTVVGVGKIADEHDRRRMVAYAEAKVGEQFGWATMAALALHLATGARLGFSVSGHTICSGLVATCLSRTSMVFPGDPAQCMPADLAQLFDVRPPSWAGVSPTDPPKPLPASSPIADGAE